jgi:hypothetical protein
MLVTSAIVTKSTGTTEGISSDCSIACGQATVAAAITAACSTPDTINRQLITAYNNLEHAFTGFINDQHNGVSAA